MNTYRVHCYNTHYFPPAGRPVSKFIYITIFVIPPAWTAAADSCVSGCSPFSCDGNLNFMKLVSLSLTLGSESIITSSKDSNIRRLSHKPNFLHITHLWSTSLLVYISQLCELLDAITEVKNSIHLSFMNTKLISDM